MTRTMRSAAVAAIAALAAVAAIIAADFTAPAQAQSEDETSGRIVARLLEDGRVEFGWQPTGSARVLPRSRYFPADATVDRWLRSSPVEVGGAEIGRINARLLEDGRIEFAFTPTDGERIAPQARYFPADARVGRWLRSTEIAIGPARAGYVAVSAGGRHTCAIRASDSAIACWGANGYRYYDPEAGEVRIQETGLTDAPDGSYTAVSAGTDHNCAIREDKTLACWGESPTEEKVGLTNAPGGHFTAISAGGSHTCAIRESGAIECWGRNYRGVRQGTGSTDAPPGRFTAVSAGSLHTCGLRESGAIECWGDDGYEQTYAPAGSYTAVSAGGSFTCAIRESGEIACWGNGYNCGSRAIGEHENEIVCLWDDNNPYEPTGRTLPEGSFTAISAGNVEICAIRDTGESVCWAHRTGGQSTAPAGSYTAVSTGGYHGCAIHTSSAIECWGNNEYGQTDVPTD